MSGEKNQDVDEEYDIESPPELLLGRRVTIEWGNNRYYSGIVNDFNEEKFEHHVLYDDNDKRWYRMAEKTFKFEGATYMHKGLKPGTYLTYQGEFIPYTPKDAKARTLCTFYAHVNPKALKDGDQMVVKGNLPSMGGWEGAGVPMVRSPTDPSLWSCIIETPFKLSETNKTGIMEYKYAIVNGGTVHLEGRHNRRVKSCELQYYYVMNPDKKNPRFNGYKASTKSSAFNDFMRAEFQQFLAGLISPNAFMARFTNCANCLKPSRIACEDLMGSFFQQAKQAKAFTPHLILGLLAMVGRFGLTIEETSTESTGSYLYPSYEKKTKPRPKPREWCWDALDQLDVGAAIQIDLRQDIGGSWVYCLLGLREAAERASLDGSFQWLRVIPLLQKHKQMATAATRGSIDKRSNEFMKVAGNLRVMAASARESAAQEMAANAAEEAEEKGKESEEKSSGKEEEKKEEPVGLQLADGWTKALVTYAPSVSCLDKLFQGDDFKVQAPDLLIDVAGWVKQYTWNKSGDFEVLMKVLKTAPALMRPEVPAFLVANKGCDNIKIFKSVLEVMTLCSVENKEDKEVSDGGISKSFVALDHAVKEWFRRNHSLEKEVKKEEKESGSMWSWNDDKKNPKPPTREELEERRLKCLTDASHMLDALFKVPFFASRPSGLLFELSRCHFFKGEPSDILQSICSLGHATKGLNKFSPVLASALSSKGVKILEEIVPLVSQIPAQLSRLVQIIDDTLPKTSDLSNNFLYALASAAGGNTPSLQHILGYHTIWEKLFHSRGVSPSEWQTNTRLTALFQSVYETLFSTAHQIVASTINLQKLHICIQNRAELLSLLRLLKNQELTHDLLNARVSNLRQFDATLDEVKCYVTFFSNCGVKINSVALQSKVESMTKSYDGLQLKGVNDPFPELKSHGSSISWLFTLRESSLFLNMWREVGTSCLVAKVSNGGQEKKNESKDEKSAMDGLNMQFAIEGAELTQADIVNNMLPRIKTKWKSLMNRIKTQSIGINTLRKTFATLKSKEMYLTELNILVRTGDGEPPSPGKAMPEWVANSQAKLMDYMMLERMQKWLPALIRVREVAASLITGSPDEDVYYCKLTTLLQQQNKLWNQQTLKTLTALVEPVKKEISDFTDIQMQFITVFSNCEALVEWLLKQQDIGDFNRLLQIVRSCNDETRTLSSIASLAHIRTLLLPLIYQSENQAPPPYPGLGEFLTAFRTKVEMKGDEGFWHLRNIHQTFEGLLGVIQNQTLSGGIKSCYEVRDIVLYGKFCFRASADISEVCVIEIEKPQTQEAKEDMEKNENGDEEENKVVTRTLEHMFDLRSKLMMTEFDSVPEDLVQQIGDINEVVAKFVNQLQVYSEMRDEIHGLCTAGHFEYQDKFELKLAYHDQTIDNLSARLAVLKQQLTAWLEVVADARDEYYFLNYFSMREILRIADILSGEADNNSGNVSKEEDPDAVATRRRDELQKKQEEKKRHSYNCAACTFENNINDERCTICGTPRPEHVVLPVEEKVEEVVVSDSHGEATKKLFKNIRAYNAAQDLISMLHMVSSAVDEKKVGANMRVWSSLLAEAKKVSSSGFILEALGNFLNLTFANEAKTESALDSKFDDNDDAPKAEEDDDAPLRRRQRRRANIAPIPSRRAIPPPGADAKNRADMLIRVDEEGDSKSLPIWVACAESASHVIEVVLSIYVRRARLPEPGEILFCSSLTTVEEIELLLRRFIDAKPHGREDNVFCIADIHALSYTLQCSVVERLRVMLADYGADYAASLVLVSGKSRQVLLNSLSAHTVDLPPLDEKTLSVAVNRACSLHCGETLAVTSNINGGGKTHFIKKEVGRRQRELREILYRKVPYRESSQASTLVTRLSNTTEQELSCFHLDIGHIIPANANTVLFELLIVGVLKSQSDCRVYHRQSKDMYFLEIPNSRGEKTAKALRFCSILPTTHLEVSAESLDLKRPIFTDEPACTRISSPEFSQMIYVCKFLRAYAAGKFRPGANFDAEYNPWIDADVSAEECFNLLAEYTAQDGHPSFLVFFNLLQFLYSAFTGMMQYPVFSGAFLTNTQGLEELKDAFTNLLIETSKDFTLRAVPRGAQFGQVEKKLNERELDRQIREQNEQRARAAEARLNPDVVNADAVNADDVVAVDLVAAALVADGPVVLAPEDEFADFEALDGPPDALAAPAPVQRQRSAELVQAQQGNGQQQPELVRQMSNDLASRFSEMTTWEDTEHPVVLWYTSPRGEYVEGMDILSLNPRFLDRYIKRGMKAALKVNQIDLDKDWKDLKSEEGMEIVRKVEGFMMSRTTLACDPVDPTYVVTVDNLLKMLSIQLRMRNNLPVVIMGETGCGKSSLIRQLCALIRAPLRTLNIHGGMEDQDIIDWMSDRIVEAQNLGPMERIVVFLDEVNTCNSMGLFKELVCDRSMDGLVLPDSMKIIAACNPYRLKQGLLAEAEAMAGLIFDHFAGGHAENVGTGITDPLKDLVYRVHPLPESMVDHVFDFGALAASTERLYIKAMLHRTLGVYLKEEKEEKKEEGKEKQQEKVAEKVVELAAPEPQVQVEPEPQQQESRSLFSSLGSVFGRRRSPRAAPQAQRADIPVLNINANNANNANNVIDPEIMAMIPAELRDQVSPEEFRRLQADMLKDAKKKELTPFKEFIEVYADQVCCAQEFVRELNGGERSVVSLRDVARLINVFRWFGNHFAKQNEYPWSLEEFFNVEPIAHTHVKQAVILSLAYCYHARLPRAQRILFRTKLEEAYDLLQKPIKQEEPKPKPQPQRGFGYNRYGGQFGGGQQGGLEAMLANAAKKLKPPGPKYGPRCKWLKMTAQSFKDILRTVQVSFVRHMNLGDGIALNEALLENLFMILVSILNYIPIFVIGKPGSSKSLAMTLVHSNLNGEASENDWLRSLPPVEVFSYQCSPLSTSSGIEQAFEAARRYKAEAPDTTVVVLLDEVGLAEQSPHLPLKVLHKVLDEGGNEAVVGISNWSLDPAKMNRAVHLYRPAPTVEDLSNTAEGMVKYANLKGYLQSLARAYSAVYHKQIQADFWGLREFYSTVRHINRAMELHNKPLDASIIMNAVQRNFGGRPPEMGKVLDTFASHLGFSLVGAQKQGVVELVEENLVSKEARHLMLLTKNNAALGLMFDYDILQHERTEVIFGSDFPLDQTDLQIVLNIQRIKLCMAEGITVVLVHCESLYESLYDLLNQHYTECGGQLYVRLAFGTHTRQCRIHPGFRIVVIVEKIDAYTRLAPPLLNRFEKQVMERSHLLTDAQTALVQRLREFIRLFVAQSGPKSGDRKARIEQGKAELNASRLAFCGYHGDVLSSLAQTLPKDVDSESAFQEGVERLLWVATPEAVCRMASRNDKMQAMHRVDAMDSYFKQQTHSDLSSFVAGTLEKWSDGFGSKVVAMTFSPLNFQVARVLQDHTKYKKITVLVLHELTSERDLMTKVNEFFETCAPGSIFLLQCDPLAASLRRIEHAKYICEKARITYLQKQREAKGEQKEKTKEKETEEDVEEVSELEREKGDAKEKTSDAKDSGDSKFTQDGKAQDVAKEEEDDEELGVHLLLLLHLPRNDTANFAYDFDLRWRSAFVDSIKATADTGLPDIQGMIGRSMEDIIANIDIRRVLARSFRSSLARLVYLHERSNEDVRAQIMFLLNALKTDNQFCTLTKSLITQMVEESDISLDLMQTAQQEHELTLAGTFQAALHRSISETVSSFFAVLLGHMDRNNNLALLGEHSEGVRDVWLYLCTKSITDMNVFGNLLKIGTVEVASDGLNHNFSGRFPFSFYISKMLTSMRAGAETAIGGDLETNLQNQFSLLNFTNGMSGDLPSALLQRYCYDFVCMHSLFSQAISKDDQAELVWRIASLVGGSAPTTLAQIHARYWQVETQIHSYFQIVDAVPSTREGILKLFKTADAFGCPTDLDVCAVVVSALSPQKQGWKTTKDYVSWMSKVELARPTVQSLLLPIRTDLNACSDVKAAYGNRDPEAVMSGWEKVLFYYAFCRDISLPLHIKPALTLSTLEQLEKTTLQTQTTFRALLRMLSDLNRAYSRLGQEIECDICLRIPEDPVRFCGAATCRRMVCKQCADDYLNSAAYLDGGHACFWCRTENCQPYIVVEADRHLVDDSKNKEARLRSAASRLMEFYIFDFCFSSHTGQEINLEPGLINDLILMLAKRELVRDEDDEAYTIDVVPSDAARVTLLRSLVELPDTKSQQIVRKFLLAELDLSVSEKRYLDTPLSVCYASVHENLMEDSISTLAQAEASLKSLTLADLYYTVDDKSNKEVHSILLSMATFRRCISVFAEAVCTTVDVKERKDSVAYDMDALLRIQTAMEPFLAEANSAGRVRSFRMFLLKNLERRRGISFLRSSLQQAPFKQAEWLRDWKDTGEVGLTRFLGSNKLPRINPFASFPLWPSVHSAVAACVHPSAQDLAPLEVELRNYDGDEKTQRTVFGTLLLSIFHEAFLIRVLPEIPTITEDRIQALQKWVSSSPSLGFLQEHERRILSFFSGVDVKGVDPETKKFFTLSNESSPEHIALVCVVVHVAATALASQGNDYMAFMRSIINGLGNISTSFWPCMPEDVTAMAVRVLGGRWYRCVNGHAYYVDACGRPTIIQKCATCGVDIGGTNHNPLPGQKDLDSKLEGNTEYSQKTTVNDGSDPLYCLREAKQESNAFDSVRSLTPVSARTVRFMLHSCLLVSSVANGAKFTQLVTPCLNKSYATPESAVPFFLSHLTQDFGIVKKIIRKSDDDTALLMHALLIKVCGDDDNKVQITDDQLQKLSAKLKETEQAGNVEVADLLRTQLQHLTGKFNVESKEVNGALPVLADANARNAWETGFTKQVLADVLNADGVAERIEAAQKRFSNSSNEEDDIFVAELLERQEIDEMRDADREASCPALWRYRRPFSYQDFVWQFNMNSDNKDQYVVLDEFLKDEVQLRALRYLPQLVRWQALLLQRYNRTLEQDVASETTVRQIIAKEGKSAAWMRSFEGFEEAWNLSWNFVKRFGCVVIPQVYKDVKMSQATPISFSLPTEKNEGICPLSLAQFLGQKHNHFVERVDEMLLMSGNEMQRSNARNHTISSKFFSEAHALTYDLEGEFLPFVEKQCVQYSANGDVMYNFKAAEQYLLDVYFVGKPLIELEVRMFQYANEALGAGHGLREKVKQELLTTDTESKILAELGSQSVARTCLELLETCISFLMATGDQSLRLDVGEMSLGQYVRSVLCMEEVEFGSNLVTQKVKLKHVDSLRKLLRDFTVVDPFAQVRPKYRHALDEKQKNMLTNVAATMDLEILIPVLKEYIIDQLKEEHQGVNMAIKTIVGFLTHEESDAYLSDLPWFANNFPDHLNMNQVLAVYQHLEHCQGI